MMREPRPAETAPKAFRDDFVERWEAYQKRLDAPKPTEADVDAIEQWLRCMADSSTPENERYRMYGARFDFDGDMLRGLRVLAKKLGKPGSGGPEEEVCYGLRFCQRVLFANYALVHAFQVGRLLHGAGEGRMGPAWRIVAAYSLPRLWASVVIGMAAMSGSSAMECALRRMAAPGNWFAVWLAGLLVVAWVLGMLDVERRVGRRWRRVFVRSVGLLGAGVFYSGLVGYVWPYILARCLTPEWVFDARYATLTAAAALVLAHLVQLFWHEASTAEPM